MENKPLVDLSPEAIKERKDAISKVLKLGEQTWDDLDNEGDDNEKAYWVNGFMIGYRFIKD
jgi:hypothetical protein